MPTHISSLPLSTFPTPGPGIMPSQGSPLSSPFVSQQRFPVFTAPMSPFTLVLLHGNICVGCQQRFPRKPTGEYADPPYNIAVQHMEIQQSYHWHTNQ